MAKSSVVLVLMLLSGACDANDQRTSGATVPGTTVASAALPVCGDDEHLVVDGVNPAACAGHESEPTGPTVSLDPDDSAIQLALDLVDEPRVFADIIIGTSSKIVAVDDVRFKLDDSDAQGATITVAVTSSATTDTERDNVAWAVSFAVADFWGPRGGFRNEAGEVRTAMTLVVDSIRYIASMELMIRLFDFTVTKPEFLQATRQP